MTLFGHIFKTLSMLTTAGMARSPTIHTSCQKLREMLKTKRLSPI